MSGSRAEDRISYVKDIVVSREARFIGIAEAGGGGGEGDSDNEKVVGGYVGVIKHT